METVDVPYSFTLRAVVIAGPPAAGKSTLAEEITRRYSCALLRLDEINGIVAQELGCDIAALAQEHPAVTQSFTLHFVERLRRIRYRPVLIEGCRMSHAHIFSAFVDALHKCYGDYIFLDCFYLCPPDELRQKYWQLRQARLLRSYVREGNKEALHLLRHEEAKGYCQHLEPVLEGFRVVEDGGSVLDYMHRHEGQQHPHLPPGHEALVKAIADSGTFNPFYQRVDAGGHTVIRGFTDSEKSWHNITALSLDFANKSVCDIGCMHGYFAFKIEERGGQVLGVDVDAGAIAAARLVAQARGSACRFEVFDATRPFECAFDLILACNVLHRVQDFDATCRNIFSSCSQAVLEVGKGQLPQLQSLAAQHGFHEVMCLTSHRNSTVIGQRAVCLYEIRHTVFTSMM